MTQYFNVNGNIHELPDNVNPCYYIKTNFVSISYNEAELIRNPPLTKQQQTDKKLLEIDNLYFSKFYTNILITFPDTSTGNIQLRNNNDLHVLENLHSQALNYVISGSPTTSMMIRTLENINKTITASQMVSICKSIFETKEPLMTDRCIHKDAIRALNNDITKTAIDIANYDITTGWPF